MVKTASVVTLSEVVVIVKVANAIEGRRILFFVNQIKIPLLSRFKILSLMF